MSNLACRLLTVAVCLTVFHAAAQNAESQPASAPADMRMPRKIKNVTGVRHG